MSSTILSPLNQDFEQLGATRVSKIVLLGDQEEHPKHGFLVQVDLWDGDRIVSEVWIPQRDVDEATVEVV